jgi:hypothetical protein
MIPRPFEPGGAPLHAARLVLAESYQEILGQIFRGSVRPYNRRTRRVLPFRDTQSFWSYQPPLRSLPLSITMRAYDKIGGNVTSSTYDALVCECGHQGRLRCRENDAPFSKSWEEYSLEGFEGGAATFEPFCSDTKSLLVRLAPKCPQCGQSGKVRYA